MIRPIIDKSDPRLRLMSREIPLDAFETDNIQSVIADLAQTLESIEDGVGLSAIQIAEDVRIFVISHKAFEVDKIIAPAPMLLFINPVIIESSQETQIFEEGCLSIRGVYGDVERSQKITIEFYNEKGELFSLEAENFLAQVIQHEMDHLDGILFIDKAENIHTNTKPHHAYQE